jgi:Sec-independent protein translocase protein TatA
VDILGVGPLELVAIFIIMLVVAGPKRMARWAYLTGQYLARFRAMFQETMVAIQREVEDSGLDIRQDIQDVKKATSGLTNFDIVGEASRVINQPADAKNDTKNSDSTPQTSDDPENPRYDSWLPG